MATGCGFLSRVTWWKGFFESVDFKVFGRILFLYFDSESRVYQSADFSILFDAFLYQVQL